VVLVTNITCSQSSTPIFHVLDSRLLNGAVTLSSGATVPTGTHQYSDIWWVHHDSIGYIFPTSGVEVNIETGPITGNWEDIGVVTGTTTQNLFTSWLVHENPPVARDSVAYYLRPAISLADFQASAVELRANISVVHNTPQLQAASDIHAGYYGAIFWVAGNVSFPDGLSVDTNIGCAVILKNLPNNKLSLSVADPTQTLTTGKITINVGASCRDCSVDSLAASTIINISFDTKNNAGQSNNYILTRLLP